MYPPRAMYANVEPDPKYKEAVERRIEATRKMTDAVFEYLTFDSRLALETYDMPVQKSPFFTPESLVYAVKERDKIQAQIDAMNEAAEALPEHIMPSMRPMITMSLMPLQSMLQSAEEHVSRIQQELEESAAETK